MFMAILILGMCAEMCLKELKMLGNDNLILFVLTRLGIHQSSDKALVFSYLIENKKYSIYYLNEPKITTILFRY